MQDITNVSVTTTLDLSKIDEFAAETMDNNNFGFLVNKITWDGSSWVSYRGPGRSRTGARLSVYREDTWRAFANLPVILQRELKASRKEAILQLIAAEITAGRLEKLS